MPSPFPGMDPFLEKHWGDVHTSLVTYDSIEPRYRTPYRVVVRRGWRRMQVDYYPISLGDRLPSIKVPVTVAKPGRYEIPGKLVYFFCSKADGFCARNVLDFKINVLATD